MTTTDAPKSTASRPLWILVTIVIATAIYFAVVDYERHRERTPDEIRVQERNNRLTDLHKARARALTEDFLHYRITDAEFDRRMQKLVAETESLKRRP